MQRKLKLLDSAARSDGVFIPAGNRLEPLRGNQAGPPRHSGITRDQNWLGRAIHPGEMLLEEYLEPLGVGPATQV